MSCEKGSFLDLLECSHEYYGELLGRVKTSLSAVCECDTAGERESLSVKTTLSTMWRNESSLTNQKKLPCCPFVVWHIPADTYMTSSLLHHGRRPYCVTPTMRLGSIALIVLTHMHRAGPKKKNKTTVWIKPWTSYSFTFSVKQRGKHLPAEMQMMVQARRMMHWIAVFMLKLNSSN